MKREDMIRNFCIIAHIDHGKSTLADRLIEKTGVMSLREMSDQVLDTMDLERERGITIKAQAVRMPYKAKDGQYLHPEPDRHPRPCGLYLRGVPCLWRPATAPILVVDASQGIEAQTLANVYLAAGHTIWRWCPSSIRSTCPAPSPEVVHQEIEDVIGLDTSDGPDGLALRPA